jgi:hypothetical protein
MNSAENIRNAFVVVQKTYENVNKLMEYCKTIAAEKSNYTSAMDKFLRYKSDNDYSGWCIKDFILLFQRRSDIELENEWRDGPVFAIEIELCSDNLEQMPTVYLSKFEYSDIGSWGKGCSPASHWQFYYPLRYEERMNFETNGEISKATPKTKEMGDRYYRGLTQVRHIHLPLIDINADNAEEKIFGNFDKL